MNKYINSNITNGIKQIRIGILNAIHEVIRSNTNKIEFEEHIPYSLLLECLDELGLHNESQHFVDLESHFINLPNNIVIEFNEDTGQTIIEKYDQED